MSMSELTHFPHVHGVSHIVFTVYQFPACLFFSIKRHSPDVLTPPPLQPTSHDTDVLTPPPLPPTSHDSHLGWVIYFIIHFHKYHFVNED